MYWDPIRQSMRDIELTVVDIPTYMSIFCTELHLKSSQYQVVYSGLRESVLILITMYRYFTNLDIQFGELLLCDIIIIIFLDHY